MASNNFSPSPCNFANRRRQTSMPSFDKAQAQTLANDCDGLESDDDYLIALSLLPKMEMNRALLRNEDGNFPHKALGHNHPKDPQVHQLVLLVQQCVANELPETDGQTCRHSCEVQPKVGHHVEFSERIKENRSQQQEIGDEAELCGRRRDVATNFDVDNDVDDSIEYRITNEVAPGLSNQDEVDAPKHVDDRDTSTPEIEELNELVKQATLSAATTRSSRLRVLSILTDNMTVKGICVPHLPRGRDGRHSSSDFDNANTSKPNNNQGGSCRHKFRFSEKEVLQLLDDEDANVDSTLIPVLLNSYRRLSENSKTIVALPLRRKSCSMERHPPKSTDGFGSSHVAGIATPEVAALPSVKKSTKQLWAARRKSTSACHIIAPSMPPSRRNSRIFAVKKQQILAFNNKKKAAASSSETLSGSPRSPPSASPPSSPVPTTQSQMELRARERTSDGVPELVNAKKPVHFVMWHWNDRCVRDPFMSAANYMELGPAQHGIMLRQLRYVKLMMYDLPWAKAHLRALLSKYTAKEVSKGELYPQLNALGQQVQRETSSRARQHRALTARKERLTVTMTLATSVVNDTKITKFGRRGRPHASRLLYDPKLPFQLHWRRKHGKWSAEYLAVDEIQVIEVPGSSRLTGGAELFGRGNKKTVAASAVDPESCLSFVTPTRSLDLQAASSLHREWLANAVRDLVSVAQQQKVTRANTANLSDRNF